MQVAHSPLAVTAPAPSLGLLGLQRASPVVDELETVSFVITYGPTALFVIMGSMR